MKKLINIGRVGLLAILFVLGITNICFADVYSPPLGLTPVASILGITVFVLIIAFLISVIVMIIAKVGKSEELFSKSKNISGSLAYYILFGYIMDILVFDLFYGELKVGILITSALAISLFVKIKYKKKAVACLVILASILIAFCM